MNFKQAAQEFIAAHKPSRIDVSIADLWLEMYARARRINVDRMQGVLPSPEDTVRLLELLDKTTPVDVQSALDGRQNKKEVTA